MLPDASVYKFIVSDVTQICFNNNVTPLNDVMKSSHVDNSALASDVSLMWCCEHWTPIVRLIRRLKKTPQMYCCCWRNKWLGVMADSGIVDCGCLHSENKVPSWYRPKIPLMLPSNGEIGRHRISSLYVARTCPESKRCIWIMPGLSCFFLGVHRSKNQNSSCPLFNWHDIYRWCIWQRYSGITARFFPCDRNALLMIRI